MAQGSSVPAVGTLVLAQSITDRPSLAAILCTMKPSAHASSVVQSVYRAAVA